LGDIWRELEDAAGADDFHELKLVQGTVALTESMTVEEVMGSEIQAVFAPLPTKIARAIDFNRCSGRSVEAVAHLGHLGPAAAPFTDLLVRCWRRWPENAVVAQALSDIWENPLSCVQVIVADVGNSRTNLLRAAFDSLARMSERGGSLSLHWVLERLKCHKTHMLPLQVVCILIDAVDPQQRRQSNELKRVAYKALKELCNATLQLKSSYSRDHPLKEQLAPELIRFLFTQLHALDGALYCISAIRALGSIGDKSGVSALESCLDHPEPAVQALASQALVLIQNSAYKFVNGQTCEEDELQCAAARALTCCSQPGCANMRSHIAGA